MDAEITGGTIPLWLEPDAARAALGFPLTVLPPPATASPEAAIRFLVQHARAAGLLSEAGAEAAVRGALRREQLGPTAVGGGLALPHAKVDRSALPHQAGVLGYAGAGVAWDSPDGQPVRLACLLLLWPRGGEMLRFGEAVRGYFESRGHPGLKAR